MTSAESLQTFPAAEPLLRWSWWQCAVAQLVVTPSTELNARLAAELAEERVADLAEAAADDSGAPLAVAMWQFFSNVLVTAKGTQRAQQWALLGLVRLSAAVQVSAALADAGVVVGCAPASDSCHDSIGD